jgi:hypothetical protein
LLLLLLLLVVVTMMYPQIAQSKVYGTHQTNRIDDQPNGQIITATIPIVPPGYYPHHSMVGGFLI